MNKGGLVVKKKEMTKIRADGKYLPATMLKVVPQEIIRYKNEEQDGYSAAVVWVEKKELKNKKKGIKTEYLKVLEFQIDDDFVQAHKEWEVLDSGLLENTESLTVVGVSKGKGFQWVMKRFHTKWGPKTHGSKFHRQVWSLGNRKPRRVQKWHPHAWRMGGNRTTLKGLKILERIIDGKEQILIVKWSVPGAYNDLLTVVIE